MKGFQREFPTFFLIKKQKRQILFLMKIIKKISLILCLGFLAAILVAIGYYFSVTKEVILLPEKLVFDEKNILLYDGNGEIIKSSTAFFKQTTAIQDIPEHTKRAFIDVEDKRFYQHSGYDIRRIARASWNNLQAKSFKEGAPTISQQLIKNTHLSQEKTVKRKLQEWKLTRSLEKCYTKDEILEKYLNTIYFGHRCFGITSASAFYFEKTPAQLTVAESAVLAGLVKSPNYYSPFKSPERCQTRKSVVLNAMLKNGSITEKEKNIALNTDLPPAKPLQKENNYASFVFDELTELAEKHLFSIGGKMQIYTYLQPTFQEILEEKASTYTQSDKTLLVLDNEQRGFTACFSTVGNIRRLPGSLIKPLLSYAPALEENVLSPATPLLDEKINYGGYSPENYDGKHHGYVSARECVEKSLNIPAVKVLESLGIEKGAAYLQKLGLTVAQEDKSLALALGGMKEGYTLKELLSAYNALACGGKFGECGFIARVKINDTTVYEKHSANTQVFSEDSAYLMTDMLKTTAKTGTAKKLRTLPIDIAAKTGTVGTKNGNTDAYALSYTTKNCIGVWLGNADNSTINCTGGGMPCTLLHDVNQSILQFYERNQISVPNFSMPQTITKIKLDKASYYDTHTISLADELSPKEYQISELFKTSAIPLNKSTSFSNPHINPPLLRFENNHVIITMDKASPSYYTYKIERYDYVTHTTIYNGKFLSNFIDDKLCEGKTYLYTITPYYQNRAGTPISLPCVSTKKKDMHSLNDNEILQKEWWEY